MGVKLRKSEAKVATPAKSANGTVGRKSLPAKSPKPQTPAKSQSPVKSPKLQTPAKTPKIQTPASSKRKSTAEPAGSASRKKSFKEQQGEEAVEEEESTDEDFEGASDEEMGSEEEEEEVSDLMEQEGEDAASDESGEDEEASGEGEDSEDEEGSDEEGGEKPKAKKETQQTKAEKQAKKPASDADDRTAFVGNLPKDIDKKEIIKMFSKYGKVETVRLRSIPVADSRVPPKVAAIKKEFHADRTNVNAYVVFTSADSVDKALKANNTMVEGRHIRVDRLSRPSQDQKKAIFVGNIPFSTDEEQLREIFESCGEIVSVRVVRQGGIGKGFAYVNFMSAEAVEVALLKNGTKLQTREIRVFRSQSSPKRRGQQGKQQSASGEGQATPGEGNKKKRNRKNKGKKGGSPDKKDAPPASFQGQKTDEQGKVQKKKKQKKASPKKQEAIETLVKTLPSASKKGKKN